MHNVVIVCTHHSEFGKSNSEELYKIIKSIKPDIIFEELDQGLFDRFYEENSIPFEITTPEVKAVKRYIKEYNAINIPVDIDLSNTLSDNEINFMFSSLEKYQVYSRLLDSQEKMVFKKGYDFLNSKENEELTEEKMTLEKELIKLNINKYKLLRIYELFYKEQHTREHGIIRNIYNYSEKIVYNQGLLLVGSGHRRTIFEKIKKYKSENQMLNWVLYGSR